MSRFAEPFVAWSGSEDPDAPLVVLLHGRGSSERDIIGLAQHLPAGPAYAAVRAPIAEGGGYAWFANRGIGRPVAASLAETMAWFRTWLDEVAPAGRPVVLAGLSGGAAFAGGLVLADPARFTGAAILYGTLPFDAGVAVTTGRLAGLPMLVAQGEQDTVIPAELLGRTWDYLLGDSGAPTVARRDPGGHGITVDTLGELASWIAHRLHHVEAYGAAPVGPPTAVTWSTLPDGALPVRRGGRPRVTWSIPQQQVSDQATVDLQAALHERLAGLPGVVTGPSAISVPGARAFTLAEPKGPDHAFLVPGSGEFAHLHPEYDGSMHLALPVELAADAIAKGWAQPHMWAGTRLSPGFVMVYGPRDEAELEVVAGIATASHAFADAAA